MFQKLKERVNLTIQNSLLAKYNATDLEAGKRLVSIIAGVYVFQKGIRNIQKYPILAVEEVALAGILFYSAAAGLHKKVAKKPVDIADVRKIRFREMIQIAVCPLLYKLYFL